MVEGGGWRKGVRESDEKKDGIPKGRKTATIYVDALVH